MNSGTNTATVSSEGSNDIRPTGPAGSVTAVEINSAVMNRSNASAFTELAAEFNVTPDVSGIPDLVMKVAVINNRADNLTLNGSGFTATLDNGSSTMALNNFSVTVEPNVTVFPVLGFRTNGTNVTSVNYSSGSITFPVNLTFENKSVLLPEAVTSMAPSGDLMPAKNLSFENLAAWNISLGGDSPMPVKFANGSVVLALMTVENLNSTSLDLNASDFWLDVGNGTWVQSDIGVNNNIPSRLANNTTVPFLVGFRLAENMTSNGSVFFWPDRSNIVSEIPLKMREIGNATPALALEAMWNNIATKANETLAMRSHATLNMTTNTSLNIELMVAGDNVSASNVTNVTVWTLMNGPMNVTPMVSADNKSLNVTVPLQSGDRATLMSYTIGNETKYVWLRPLALRT